MKEYYCSVSVQLFADLIFADLLAIVNISVLSGDELFSLVQTFTWVLFAGLYNCSVVDFTCSY